MALRLPTEHHLELLSLKGGCTDSSESTFVKVPHCWKSHVAAQLFPQVITSILSIHVCVCLSVLQCILLMPLVGL